MMKEELQKIGLSENESKVYLALLKAGLTNAGVIIKSTKLHRNIVYDNLDRLIDKGLVSFVIMKNIKHFEVTSSKELKEYVEKRKQQILEEEKIVRDILPQIDSMRLSRERKQDAAVFNGKRGLKTILEEITRSKSDLLVFGTGWGMRWGAIMSSGI
jgi:sugar-specific transcriptional regulator TrmB